MKKLKGHFLCEKTRMESLMLLNVQSNAVGNQGTKALSGLGIQSQQVLLELFFVFVSESTFGCFDHLHEPAT
jgi:hypothetical protein